MEMSSNPKLETEIKQAVIGLGGQNVSKKDIILRVMNLYPTLTCSDIGYLVDDMAKNSREIHFPLNDEFEYGTVVSINKSKPVPLPSNLNPHMK